MQPRRRIVGIERHTGGTGQEDGDLCGDHFRHRRGTQRDAVAGLHACRDEFTAQAERGGRQELIGNRALLVGQRDAVRLAGGLFEKQVTERALGRVGDGSCRTTGKAPFFPDR